MCSSRRIPTFAQSVDAAGCIAILIVATIWLGVWNSKPSQHSGTLAQGDGYIRLGANILAGFFLVFLPAFFLPNLRLKVGGLGRRAAINVAVVAFAVVIAVIRQQLHRKHP